MLAISSLSGNGAVVIQANTYDFDNFVTHASDEICLLEEGEMTILYGSQSTVLQEGDTILIPKNVPHGYYNHTYASGYIALFWVKVR